MYRVDLEGGKYTIIEDLNNGKFIALRYGEEWRKLLGDNLVLALVNKIQELEGQNMKSISTEEYEWLVKGRKKLAALECGGVDNWDGYGYAMNEFYECEEEGR